MIRLHIIVEGQTEETFVNQLLAPHLVGAEIFTDAHCVTTSRQGGRPIRGGLPNYAKARRDIVLWMKGDRNDDARFTTFFDFYGLRNKDSPGYEEALSFKDPYDRVDVIEKSMAEDIADRRFVPYIQLHEFEALLLVDPRHLESAFIEHEQAIRNLVALAAEYRSPELIDDGMYTAPSKRIIKEIPGYAKRKASVGPLVTAKIGLPKLRESCPHFNSWLKKLEELSVVA